MSNIFIKALQSEIFGLEESLKADPTFQKLQEARRLLALYTLAPIATHAYPMPPIKETRGRRASNSPILDMAAEFIAGRQTPTSTSDIYDHISLRMTIPGNAPKNNLAAKLSNSDRFRAHGRSGWTLKLETPEASDEQLALATSEESMSIPDSLSGEPSVRPVNPVPGGGA